MIGMPVPPAPSPETPPSSAPAPKGRNRVLGGLAVVVVLGLALIVWLGGWLDQRREEQLAERARIHHLRRVGEDQLRGGIGARGAGGNRPGAVTPERMRAGEMLVERARELYVAHDWAGVIQCAGLLEDLPTDDPELGRMVEAALFNRALQLLRRDQAAPALECLHQLLSRRPADRQASDLRSIGMTIKDYGPGRQTAAELERFSERP
jgi:hypothetical protein